MKTRMVLEYGITPKRAVDDGSRGVRSRFANGSRTPEGGSPRGDSGANRGEGRCSPNDAVRVIAASPLSAAAKPRLGVPAVLETVLVQEILAQSQRLGTAGIPVDADKALGKR